MEEDIHNESKKHIGAACISYNAEQLANDIGSFLFIDHVII